LAAFLTCHPKGEKCRLSNKTFFTHNFGVGVEYSQFKAADNEVGADDEIFLSLIGLF